MAQDVAEATVSLLKRYRTSWALWDSLNVTMMLAKEIEREEQGFLGSGCVLGLTGGRFFEGLPAPDQLPLANHDSSNSGSSL